MSDKRKPFEQELGYLAAGLPVSANTPSAANEAINEIDKLRSELAAARAELAKMTREAINLRSVVDAEPALRAQYKSVFEERDEARKGLLAVETLINESRGVYGLHQNDDPAPWSELRTGGRFEDWLTEFDRALECLRKGAT